MIWGQIRKMEAPVEVLMTCTMHNTEKDGTEGESSGSAVQSKVPSCHGAFLRFSHTLRGFSYLLHNFCLQRAIFLPNQCALQGKNKYIPFSSNSWQLQFECSYTHSYSCYGRLTRSPNCSSILVIMGHMWTLPVLHPLASL